MGGKQFAETLNGIPLEKRQPLYDWVGSKYNHKWGPLVLEWFVEDMLSKGDPSWVKRWDLFSTYFNHSLPRTSLYDTMDKMEKEGLLETKRDSRAVYFRLKPEAIKLLLGISEMKWASI